MLIPLDIFDNQRFSAWWFKKYPTRVLQELVYTTKVETDGNLFCFNATGTDMAILPVVKDDQILDLVAWQPNYPDKWFLRCGVYNAYLGWDDLTGVEYKNPHEWLYNYCEGHVKL